MRASKSSKKFRVKAVRDALFRCACILDDIELFRDLIYYFKFDLDERLCPYIPSSDIDIEPTIFQQTAVLPLVIALTSVYIHNKTKVISEMFALNVRLIRPADNLPNLLLQCNSKLVHYNWLRHYSETKNRQVILDLSGSHLAVIPSNFLEALKTYNENAEFPITNIDLEDNLLDSLPPRLASIPEVKEVTFRGNPMTLMDWSIDSDWNSIKDYLISLESRASQWNMCKILVLGQADCGKSTLIECLKRKKSISQCKFSYSTRGISISSGICLDRVANESKVRFNIWDIGKEETLYPTHQLLLSNQAVYIISFDLPSYINQWESERFEFLSKISYWLQLIRQLSKESDTTPTYLVGTRLDLCETSENNINEFMSFLRKKFPREMYYYLKDILFTSCKTGLGLEELKQKIISTVESPGFLQVIPKSWVCLHDLLSSFQTKGFGSAIWKKSQAVISQLERSSSILGIDSKDSRIITWQAFNAFAAQCNVEDISAATKFLSNNGCITYYNNIKYPELQSIVILDPQWIIDTMSTLTSIKISYITSNSHINDVSQRFNEFPQPLRLPILQLLLENQIVFLYKPDNDNKSHIIMPSLLSSDLRYNTIINYWPLHYPDSYVEQGRIYRFNHAPNGFFEILMNSILNLSHITPLLLWQSGIIIEYDSQEELNSKEILPTQIAYLTISPALELCVRVRTPKAQRYGRKLLLRSIIDVIETHITVVDPHVKRYVPCSHCIDKKNSKDSSIMRHSRATDILGSRNEEGVFEFAYIECVQTLLKGERSLWCNHIKSPSRRVRLVELAPDLSYSNISILRANQIEVQNILGEGSFGSVYQGILTIPGSDELSQVAIKRLKENEAVSIPLFLEFYAEVEIMSMMDDPNLVNLTGITLNPELQIVMEYIQHGDLFGLLHPTHKTDPIDQLSKISDEEFSWRERLLIALDIARGMNVLQTSKPPIVHRDLRSANIFIYSRSLDPSHVRAKVGDFGLSRIVPVEMKGFLETWKWLAPEVISPNSYYGSASDVYSFAIICWEIATKCFPFDELYTHPFYSYSAANLKTRMLNEEKIKEDIIGKNLRPSLEPIQEQPEYSNEENQARRTFIRLISDCWQGNPLQRPTFKDIIDRLLAALKLSTGISVITQQGKVYRSSQLIKKNSVSTSEEKLCKALEEASKQFVMDHSVFIKEPNGTRYTTAITVPSKVGQFTKESIWVGSSFGMLSVFQLNSVSFQNYIF